MLRITFLLFTLSFSISTFCQSQISGLWEVTLVEVGGQTPTPTAKWFDLKTDGQMLSGNGGVINQRGSWLAQNDQKEILFAQPSGEQDPSGPFTIDQLTSDQMTWKRNEEGMDVTIQLKKIQELPMANWDLLQGNWKIKEFYFPEKDEVAFLDPDQHHTYFFRWDHLYKASGGIDRKADTWGIWQIHGHKAELRMMRLDGQENVLWSIERLKEDQLWLSNKESEQTAILKLERQ
ncbi:MAG: hypothetical protein AAF242_05610 [Bacteroidota bacterium]